MSITREIRVGCALGILLTPTFVAAAADHKKKAGKTSVVAEQPAPQPPFNVVEATIPQMRAAMEQGRLTSRQLVRLYLERIGMYEDKLHAAITVNPNVLAEADERDRERASGHVRGPLHGIPIALKDNVLTHDIVTTGGALAFDGYVPPYDATLVKNLRDAGAVIIAKTGMTELANWVAGAPTPMPSDYNAEAGYGYNPYDPRRDPREATFDGRPALFTGGSSSGIGTAANFWAGNVGSETSGSILSPSNQNMLAAVKPTVGRISRYGVIPITADQDTAGPMAKSVTDVAIMLGALESPAPDPNDPATNTCKPPANRDYTQFLKTDALQGVRIGIPRAYFYDKITLPGGSQRQGTGAVTPGTATVPSTEAPSTAGPVTRPPTSTTPGGGRRGNDAGFGGLSPEEARLMTEAIDILKQHGAAIVDPVEIPSISTQDPDKNLLRWNPCGGINAGKGRDANCSVVLKYGMKRDFNKFLASLGPSAPVKTLTELREWNMTHTMAGAIKYGQSLLDISDEMNVETDRQRYEADRAKDILLAGSNGMEAAIKANNLDALLFPGPNGAAIAARPGYPTAMVPFGFVPNEPANAPFPPGFNPKPSPFGVSFSALACSEPKLLGIAYAFEQATKRRVPPASAP